MGCCGGRYEDPDIKNAESVEALIVVMKDKRDKTAEEQVQIKAHLENKNAKVTTSDINGLSKEDLEKRVPYLGILYNYYKEAIDLLTENQKLVKLPEAKEHMYAFYDHYLKCSEPEENVKTTMGLYKDYLSSLKKK